MITDTERTTDYPSILLARLLGMHIADDLERESVWQLIGYVLEDANKEGYAEGYERGWQNAREDLLGRSDKEYTEVQLVPVDDEEGMLW